MKLFVNYLISIKLNFYTNSRWKNKPNRYIYKKLSNFLELYKFNY